MEEYKIPNFVIVKSQQSVTEDILKKRFKLILHNGKLLYTPEQVRYILIKSAGREFFRKINAMDMRMNTSKFIDFLKEKSGQYIDKSKGKKAQYEWKRIETDILLTYIRKKIVFKFNNAFLFVEYENLTEDKYFELICTLNLNDFNDLLDTILRYENYKEDVVKEIAEDIRKRLTYLSMKLKEKYSELSEETIKTYSVLIYLSNSLYTDYTTRIKTSDLLRLIDVK